MEEFKPEDMPVIIDATFVLAIQAYSMAFYACCKDHGGVEENFTIKDVLLDRFKSQGIDTESSERVAGVVDSLVSKSIKDLEDINGN